jgi:class 3 adenylate cyclase
LDAEEWREVVSGAHRRVSAAVARYEGTVAQLLGDGVLAFFGAPIAHEDDPARAVRMAMYRQADRRLVAEHVLVVPAIMGGFPELRQPWVRGAEPNKIGHLSLKDILVEKQVGA